MCSATKVMPSWQHESFVVINYHYNCFTRQMTLHFSRLNLFFILIIPLKQQKKTKFDALKTAKKKHKIKSNNDFCVDEKILQE
jgi:hypothetical protein